MIGNKTKVLLSGIPKFAKNQMGNKMKAGYCAVNNCNQIFSNEKSRFHRTPNGFYNLLNLNQKFGENLENGKYFSIVSAEKCWSCQKPLEQKKITCASCGVLQPPKSNVNFFELLNISQSFNLNVDELSEKFKKLQITFHPDKFANKSQKELEISEEYSRLLNNAYKTLKDPLSRGFYLLQILKQPVEVGYPMEKEFLMMIMEKNEELESIESDGGLVKFTAVNNEETNHHITKVSEAFQTSNYQDAKINLMKLNYYVNLNNKIKEKKGSFMENKDK